MCEQTVMSAFESRGGCLRRGEELGEGVLNTGVPALDETVGLQQQRVSRVELDLTFLVLGLSERAEEETAEHRQGGCPLATYEDGRQVACPGPAQDAGFRVVQARRPQWP